MKIEADSGYAGFQAGRGYYVSARVVTFDNDTTTEELHGFIDAEKKSWYGQEFSARIEGKKVHIKRGIDSGD